MNDEFQDDRIVPDEPLDWPPPGLGRLYRSGSRVSASFVLASAFVAVPFLAWTTGLLPDTPDDWLLPVSLIGVGLLLAARALLALRRMAMDAREALRAGYPGWMIGAIAFDWRGDVAGLLGAQNHAAVMSEAGRLRVLRLDAWAGLFLLVGAAWPLAALGLVLPAAGRGTIEAAGVWWLTLGPAAALLLASMSASAVAGSLRRVAPPASAPDLPLPERAAAWRRSLELEFVAVSPAGRRRAFLPLAAIALLIILTGAASVAGVTGIGARNAALRNALTGLPGTASVRMQVAQSLRVYAPEPDSTITPSEAGIALHALELAGASEIRPLVLPPVRTYPAWQTSNHPRVMVERLMRDLVAGNEPPRLDPEQRELLQRVAAHPAHAEFAVVARAPGADVIGTRYRLPFPEDVTLFEVPVADVGGLREAGYAHVSRGLLEMANGDMRAAEMTLSEVVGYGFRIMDDAPMLLDNFVGLSIMTSGARALAYLYRTTGRTREAAILDAQIAAVQNATVNGGGSVMMTPERAVSIVRDTQAPRGLRWETLPVASLALRCAGPRHLVFGRGVPLAAATDTLRAAMVRFPADEDYFAMAMRRMKPQRESVVRRSVGWLLGGAAAMRDCPLSGMVGD